ELFFGILDPFLAPLSSPRGQGQKRRPLALRGQLLHQINDLLFRQLQDWHLITSCAYYNASAGLSPGPATSGSCLDRFGRSSDEEERLRQPGDQHSSSRPHPPSQLPPSPIHGAYRPASRPAVDGGFTKTGKPARPVHGVL